MWMHFTGTDRLFLNYFFNLITHWLVYCSKIFIFHECTNLTILESVVRLHLNKINK